VAAEFDRRRRSADTTRCALCRQPYEDPDVGCPPCKLVAMPWWPWLTSWAILALSLWMIVPYVSAGLGHPLFAAPIHPASTAAAMGCGLLLVGRGLRRSERWAHVLAVASGLLAALACGVLGWVAEYVPFNRIPAEGYDVLRSLSQFVGQELSLELWLRRVRERHVDHLAFAVVVLLFLCAQMLGAESRAHFRSPVRLRYLLFFAASLALMSWPASLALLSRYLGIAL
jgi:hypothetical protein